MAPILHSRDITTQHIKFEILNDRLSLFFCYLILFNFVLNMLVIGQICNANYHPFGDGRDDVTKSLDVCHRLDCELIEYIILRFERVYDLHFRIQTNLGQISSSKL